MLVKNPTKNARLDIHKVRLLALKVSLNLSDISKVIKNIVVENIIKTPDREYNNKCNIVGIYLLVNNQINLIVFHL